MRRYIIAALLLASYASPSMAQDWYISKWTSPDGQSEICQNSISVANSVYQAMIARLAQFPPSARPVTPFPKYIETPEALAKEYAIQGDQVFTRVERDPASGALKFFQVMVSYPGEGGISTITYYPDQESCIQAE